MAGDGGWSEHCEVPLTPTEVTACLHRAQSYWPKKGPLVSDDERDELRQEALFRMVKAKGGRKSEPAKWESEAAFFSYLNDAIRSAFLDSAKARRSRAGTVAKLADKQKLAEDTQSAQQATDGDLAALRANLATLGLSVPVEPDLPILDSLEKAFLADAVDSFMRFVRLNVDRIGTRYIIITRIWDEKAGKHVEQSRERWSTALAKRVYALARDLTGWVAGDWKGSGKAPSFKAFSIPKEKAFVSELRKFIARSGYRPNADPAANAKKLAKFLGTQRGRPKADPAADVENGVAASPGTKRAWADMRNDHMRRMPHVFLSERLDVWSNRIALKALSLAGVSGTEVSELLKTKRTALADAQRERTDQTTAILDTLFVKTMPKNGKKPQKT